MRRHLRAELVIASVVLTVVSACAAAEDQRTLFTPAQADNTLSLNHDGAPLAGDPGADAAAGQTEIGWKKAITVHPDQIFQPL